MITDDRLSEIRKMIEDLDRVVPRPWRLWKGRSDKIQKIPSQQVKKPDGSTVTVPEREIKTPARYDCFSGPELNDSEDIRQIVNKGCIQVCHWHPESPTIYDKSTAYEVTMPFITKSVDIVEELLNEIEELKRGTHGE